MKDGIPSKEVLSFFAGAWLTQVCFGTSDLQLRFDGPPSCVMMQSRFGVLKIGQELRRYAIDQEAMLREFLNLDVTEAEWGEFGTLILTFQSGDQVMVFDDSDQFESYTISHDKTLIVV